MIKYFTDKKKSHAKKDVMSHFSQNLSYFINEIILRKSIIC